MAKPPQDDQGRQDSRLRLLVTGGVGGIGSAVCRRLESEGHEAVTVDRGVNADGVSPHISADFSIAGEPDRAVRAAARQYGRLDGIVNCVGTYSHGDLGSFQ